MAVASMASQLKEMIFMTNIRCILLDYPFTMLFAKIVTDLVDMQMDSNLKSTFKCYLLKDGVKPG